MRQIRLLVLVALILGLWPLINDTWAVPTSVMMEKSDQEFAKHNYQEALKICLELKHKLKGPEEKIQELDLKILKIYAQLKNWDRFIATLDKYFKKETIWQARAFHFAAMTYQNMPHQGFRRDGKIYRDMERREGDLVYLYSEDQETSKSYFYRSRKLYEKLSAHKILPIKSRDLDREIIAVNLDLLSFLNSHYYPNFQEFKILKTAKGMRQINTEWPVAEQLYFLYQEIQMLAQRAKLSHERMQADYIWVHLLLQRMGVEEKNDTDRKGLKDPLAILSEAIAAHPEDSLAPDMQLLQGDILRQRQRYTQALETYQMLIRKWPKSKLISDAQYHIQEIQWPALQVAVPGIQAPNATPRIQLNGRNMKRVKLKVHQVVLPDVLLATNRLQDPQTTFANFQANFGASLSQIKKFYGKQMLSWEWTPDVQPYHHFSQAMDLEKPLPPGAYIVEATGSDAESAALLLISDLAVVEHNDRDKTVFFVTEADSGHPLAGADLTIKEYYYTNKNKVVVSRVKTNSQGLFIYHSQVPASTSSRVEAFAQKETHYTMTGVNYWSRYHAQEKYYRVYSTTDRPVYRPGQVVQFNHIVRLYDNGSYHNQPGENVKIVVYNPKGEKIYEKTLATDRFGSVHDQIKLKEEPPLGVYRIDLNLPEHSEHVRESNGREFRVEEYKRPEFKVSVEPVSNTPPRPGEMAKMRIKADYFFGAPVTAGKIKYTVYKKIFYMNYQPKPSPYQWLYGAYDREINRYPYQGSGQVIKQEEVTMTEQGYVDIEFPTDKNTQDMEYDIQAEVTDASRRTIQGEGSLTVTHQSFYAFMDFERGFYAPGDRVDVEIDLVTLDRQAMPSQTGQLQAWLLKEGEKSEPIGDPVLNETVTSDSQGRIFYRWKPKREGKFKLIFTSRDRFERPVKASQELWVVGNHFQGNHYRFQNVELLTDRRLYKEGETVRLMINSQFEDSHVLLFEEGGDEILSYGLHHLLGHSKVITFPIKKQHIPNFQLRAIMLQQRTLYQDSRELFVPPIEQFLEMTVKMPKEAYRPGEKTRLQLQVRDHQGKPVQTAVSLGVVDASIYYIQPDVSGDIRTFYYGDRRSSDRYVSTSLNTGFSSITKVHRTWKKHPLHQRRNESGRFSTLMDGFSGEADDLVAEAPASTNAQSPPAPAPKMAKQDDNRKKESKPEQKIAKPQIRQNFAETAFWTPIVVTDTKGNAQLEFAFPDSLTTWNIQARGVTTSTQVGRTAHSVKTTKNILLRMQAPRFFIERDEVVLSANVRNQFSKAQSVRCELQVPGELMDIQGKSSISIDLPANSEKRVDWRVKVKKEGQARLLMKALASSESDAVQMDFPVYVHGVDKTVVQNGVLKDVQNVKEIMSLPAERRQGAGELTITLNPSLAGTLLEALPYLAEYPYGCVEQTTSRFIPAVLTAHTLRQQGLDLENLGKQRNLNASQLSIRVKNPLWNSQELTRMVNEGMKRLYEFQNSDGGWGWWSGNHSDPYMSAYVLYALQLARQTDYAPKQDVVDRGLTFLKKEFEHGEQGVHLQTYMAFVLSLDKRIQSNQLDTLFKKRDQLNHYSKALLALSYHYLGNVDKSRLIMENLKSFVKKDVGNGTASWPSDDHYWWYWYGDRVETNAFILKAYVNILPNDPLVPMLVRWLVNNRQGNRWSSTKDTAQVLYAMNDYLQHSHELNPNYLLRVRVNGKVYKEIQVDHNNVLTFDNQVMINDRDLPSGKNEIQIEKTGKDPLYYNATLRYFSKEENIKGSGNEVFVKREYYRYLAKLNQETQKVEESRTLLKPGDILKSGEELEVKLTVESKNDYEYLILEDMKPAGTEAIALKSGYVYQNGVYLNRELRDEKVVFFMTVLPQGTQVLTYRLRAEVPGVFHALPHQIQAMYAPQVRALSDEAIVRIED